MAYLWSNPYGFTMGEWFALTTWQKFRIFLWRHRYQRGYNCFFLRDRARVEFLGKSIRPSEYQCRCSKVGSKNFCWCKCTPDGTLAQGFNEETKYICKEGT